LRALALEVENKPWARSKAMALPLAAVTAAHSRSLKRHFVGGLPLLHRLAERIGLRSLLERYVPTHGNDQFPVVDTLMLLVYNLTLGKDPLYELQAWVSAIEPRAIGYRALEVEKFGDDRFGRALDRLYRADRASLMTEVVTAVVHAFALELPRVHNDSTTVKAYGKYPGRTASGLALKQGICPLERAREVFGWMGSKPRSGSVARLDTVEGLPDHLCDYSLDHEHAGRGLGIPRTILEEGKATSKQERRTSFTRRNSRIPQKTGSVRMWQSGHAAQCINDAHDPCLIRHLRRAEGGCAERTAEALENAQGLWWKALKYARAHRLTWPRSSCFIRKPSRMRICCHW
jgi:hypothetical protein